MAMGLERLKGISRKGFWLLSAKAISHRWKWSCSPFSQSSKPGIGKNVHLAGKVNHQM
jgi:hypothetical protein